MIDQEAKVHHWPCHRCAKTATMNAELDFGTCVRTTLSPLTGEAQKSNGMAWHGVARYGMAVCPQQSSAGHHKVRLECYQANPAGACAHFHT